MKFCVSPDRLIPACRRLALHYIDCPSVSIGSDDCYDLNERYWDDQLQSKLSQLLTYLLQHKRATDLTRLIVCNSRFGAERTSNYLNSHLKQHVISHLKPAADELEFVIADQPGKENRGPERIFIVADDDIISQLPRSSTINEIIHLSLPFKDDPKRLFSFHLRRCDDLEVDFQRYLKRYELIASHQEGDSKTTIAANDSSSKIVRRCRCIHLVPEDTSKPFNDLVWTLERLFAFSRLGEREYLNLSINDCIRNVLEEAHCANDKSHQQRCQSFALERIGLSQGKDLEIMQKFKSLLKQSFVDESFSPIVKLGDGDDDKDNNPFL